MMGLQRLDFRYFWSPHGYNTRQSTRGLVSHVTWSRPIAWKRMRAAPDDGEGSDVPPWLDLDVRMLGLQRLDFRYYWSPHGPNNR